MIYKAILIFIGGFIGGGYFILTSHYDDIQSGIVAINHEVYKCEKLKDVK
jgi:hypothetical protein